MKTQTRGNGPRKFSRIAVTSAAALIVCAFSPALAAPAYAAPLRSEVEAPAIRASSSQPSESLNAPFKTSKDTPKVQNNIVQIQWIGKPANTVMTFTPTGESVTRGQTIKPVAAVSGTGTINITVPASRDQSTGPANYFLQKSGTTAYLNNYDHNSRKFTELDFAVAGNLTVSGTWQGWTFSDTVPIVLGMGHRSIYNYWVLGGNQPNPNTGVFSMLNNNVMWYRPDPKWNPVGAAGMSFTGESESLGRHLNKFGIAGEW